MADIAAVIEEIRRTVERCDPDRTMGAGALGEWIAADLELIGVSVSLDWVAQAIRRVDGRNSMTPGELAEALAPLVGAVEIHRRARKAAGS